MIEKFEDVRKLLCELFGILRVYLKGLSQIGAERVVGLGYSYGLDELFEFAGEFILLVEHLDLMSAMHIHFNKMKAYFLIILIKC